MSDGPSSETQDLPMPSLGLDLGAVPQSAAAAPYRVLARKYRPANFDDLIGQEAMVRTLGNAFALGRIHQAYILTGVRGVGKTTTARILARAFNYELPARGDQPAVTKPTIHMPEMGVHCQAIIESRHVDVIEMDAASHTGIDDIREIIESARYRPVMARTKVFIIDEVHMLSKAAFNGLLKTLEEPPEHVRFLFATTEIERVPVTVRSRCQRFDLRRIESDVLIRHLSGICDKEGVKIDADALALIARASEGSVRDSLSILDQAIAHGGSADHISLEGVALMLGLADRARIIDLFESIMRGDVKSALDALKEQYDLGADPALVLTDLAEFVHFVTRLKLIPDSKLDAAVTQQERQRGAQFAQSLSMPVLTRAWQLLVKGLAEIKDSPRPLAAADMVLVRLAYAADLPTPDDVLRRLAQSPSRTTGADQAGGSAGAPRGPMASASSQPIMSSGQATLGSGQATPRPILASSQSAVQYQHSAPAVAIAEAKDLQPRVHLHSLEDVVKLAQAHRDIQLKMALERDVHLIRFEEGSIEFSLAPGASPQLAATLMRRLQEWTGLRWMVAISNAPGGPSLKQVEDAKEAERLVGVRAEPLVRNVLERFPGAEI
ncbi:MAG: DNA polymerase III subunit gamma/tau, partial [Alphaproteobacteria bacterium]|nr:DNA polymerase III subunit gamma/tau [Alphaproteobacteria bacterium]